MDNQNQHPASPNETLDDPTPDTPAPRLETRSPQQQILVLGLGRGGGRVAARLARHGRFPRLCTVAADTDFTDLESLEVDRALPYGEKWCRGEGCGGDGTQGERAAADAGERFRGLLGEAAFLVGIAGLGGGTGAGACNVVARLARKAKLPSLFVVTLPFVFEGEWVRRKAEQDLEQVRKAADAVIVIPNDQLFSALSPDTPAAEAFTLADSLLAEGIAGLARIFGARGLIPIGLDNVKSILAKRKSASILGIGRGEGGEQGCRKAIEDLLASPLVGGEKTLQGIDAAVVTLLGGPELSIRDIQTGLADFQARFPKRTRLDVGAYVDEQMTGRVQLTALMCRYENEVVQPPLPLEKAAPPKSAGKGRRKRKQAADDGQYRLPLTEHSLGIFKPNTPTLVNGRNLDVPTFQRQGVEIDIGESV